MRKVACKKLRSSLGNTEITLRATYPGVQALDGSVIARGSEATASLAKRGVTHPTSGCITRIIRSAPECTLSP